MRVVICLSMFLLLASVIGTAAGAGPDYVGMSGNELYGRFCAACHGMSGRGDGPVAASLKVEVPDLTLIARRAGGAFPRDRIEQIIDGRSSIGAHGSRTMPVWGEELSNEKIGDPDAERAARVIIDRLSDYVWQLQRPQPEAPGR
jgi:mono/diheme cytochrome c family protein